MNITLLIKNQREVARLVSNLATDNIRGPFGVGMHGACLIFKASNVARSTLYELHNFVFLFAETHYYRQ